LLLSSLAQRVFWAASAPDLVQSGFGGVLVVQAVVSFGRANFAGNANEKTVVVQQKNKNAHHHSSKQRVPQNLNA
jgi:hypothetical protein